MSARVACKAQVLKRAETIETQTWSLGFGVQGSSGLRV